MFSRPTLAEIITQIESDITTRLTNAVTLLRRSILKVIAKALGGAVHLHYGNIEYNKDQMFASTADAENLELQANEFGISRLAAVKATGTGTATGTDGTIIPIYSELQSSSGQVYLTTAAATISGATTISFQAKVAGEDGNDDGSITLSFVSPIAGVNTTVTVSSAGISNGSDQETDEDLRTRVLTRKRQPPHGGADFDYVAWMKEVSGVTRAWAISLYQGIGTIGCAFVRDNDSDIFPSDAEILTVKNYIISHADPVTGKIVGIPVTAESGLYMIETEGLTVDFSIKIYPNTTEVQTAVSAKLQELINEDGGCEQTLYLSKIRQAVSAAAGESFHELLYPTSDVTATASQVHVLGTITWSTY